MKKPYVAGKTYWLRGVKVIAIPGTNCSSPDDPIMCQYHAEENCDGMDCASFVNGGQSFFFLTFSNYVKARLLGQLDESRDS